MSKYSSTSSSVVSSSEVGEEMDQSSYMVRSYPSSVTSTPRRRNTSNEEDSSELLSSLMSRLTPSSTQKHHNVSVTTTSTAIGNMKSLNSSMMSNSSSVSTKWEEMNNLAKEIESNVKKTTSNASKRSAYARYDDLSDSSLVHPSEKKLSTKIDNISMDDSLDSTASALKRYLEKYNDQSKPKPSSTSSRFNLDDSLSDLYGKLTEFSNTYKPRDVDTSLSSVTPLRSNRMGAVDDMISTASNMSTNTDELFTKLDNYGDKYLERELPSGKSPKNSKKKKADISISSVDSDKENYEPRRTKPSRKSTTPKRPQSVKVSSMKEERKETTIKSKVSTTNSTRSKTPTSKYSKPEPKKPETKKPLTTSQYSTTKSRANQAVESISKKISSREPVKSSYAKHFQKPQPKKEINNSYSSDDDETRDCKSCQTSMLHSVPTTPTMTTLASINSVPMSPGLSSASNEIAFRIVGSTDNIEKVEVYLKNSTKQSFSTNSSTQNPLLNETLLNETNIIESFCSPNIYNPNTSTTSRHSNNSPDHISQTNSITESQETLQPLKSFYSKYFVK